MVSDEFMELPIDDAGHVAHVKVSSIHTIADTLDPNMASVYTIGGAFTVALPTHEVINRVDKWYEANLRKVN